MGNCLGSKRTSSRGSIPKDTQTDQSTADVVNTDDAPSHDLDDSQNTDNDVSRNTDNDDLQKPARHDLQKLARLALRIASDYDLQRTALDHLQKPALVGLQIASDHDAYDLDDSRNTAGGYRPQVPPSRLAFHDDAYDLDLKPRMGALLGALRAGRARGRAESSLYADDDWDDDEEWDVETTTPVQSSHPVTHGTDVLLSAGTYEVELNWEGETELHNLKQNCRKNRGHAKFIPVYKFGQEHLPALYRNNLIIDLVNCLSVLTVRLTVDKISLARPNPPYPPIRRRDNLGRDCSINGTGHVTSAVVYSDETDTPCACTVCLESGNPVRGFAKIFIQTAAHVVHDDLEAANTTCYFNYVNDSDGLDTAVKVQGSKGVQIDVKEDRCWMFCYTHDLSLAKKLRVMSDNYQRLRKEVSEKYCVNWSDTPEDKLTIIVSHPHGCSKYVTIGNIQSRLAAPDDADWTQYRYTTPTCPGSSGAPIFMLGKHGYIDNHHHSGADPNTGFNVSTFGLF